MVVSLAEDRARGHRGRRTRGRARPARLRSAQDDGRADDDAARLIDRGATRQEIAVAQKRRQLHRIFKSPGDVRSLAAENMTSYAFQNGAHRGIDVFERLFRSSARL